MPCIRLGMLTRSSNKVVEPTTDAIAGSLDDVSAHSSRSEVTGISLSERGPWPRSCWLVEGTTC